MSVSSSAMFPSVFMFTMLISLFVSGIIWVVVYVLDAVGKSKLARARGMKDAWVAWIPVFGQAYMLGALVTPFKLGKLEVKGFKWWLGVLSIVLTSGSLVSASLIMYYTFSATLGIMNEYSMDLINTMAGPFFALVGVTIVVSLLAIVLSVFEFVALYRLFKLYRPDSAVLYLVLSILFGLSFVFVFIIRNDQYMPAESQA